MWRAIDVVFVNIDGSYIKWHCTGACLKRHWKLKSIRKLREKDWFIEKRIVSNHIVHRNKTLEGSNMKIGECNITDKFYSKHMSEKLIFYVYIRGT